MSDATDYNAGMEFGYLLFGRLDGPALEQLVSAFEGYGPDKSDYNNGVLEAIADANSAHYDAHGVFKMWPDMEKEVIL